MKTVGGGMPHSAASGYACSLRLVRGLALALAVVVAVAGCGRKGGAGASAPVAAAPDGAPNSNPVPPVARQAPPEVVNLPATVPAAPQGGADLRALNHAYISWIVQTRQRATSFEQYVASSGIQVPPAPAGKKYVIDHAGFIALANQ